MTQARFFGYGSLVNRATHDYGPAVPARLEGWRRAWRHTALRPVAFLTAVPGAGSAIDGLTAPVPGGDWSALDRREAAYVRAPVRLSGAAGTTETTEAAVYWIPAGAHGAPDERHPILLSYLDVVAQGFLREFGTEGLARFAATTDGWDAPVLDDRDAPRYPRHQRLTRSETERVDAMLAGLAVRVIRP